MVFFDLPENVSEFFDSGTRKACGRNPGRLIFEIVCKNF